MSQITTHILDTTLGKPAANVSVELDKKNGNTWQNIASGKTNNDGRVADLLPKDSVLEIGIYKISFAVSEYFKTQNTKSFYPSVSIEFEIFDNSHYHVPLLLNPFGYSTYRGS